MTYFLFAIYEELLVYTFINLCPHLVCVTDIIVNINAIQFPIPYRITVVNDIVYLFTDNAFEQMTHASVTIGSVHHGAL